MKEAGEKRDWRVKGMPRAPSTQPLAGSSLFFEFSGWVGSDPRRGLVSELDDSG